MTAGGIDWGSITAGALAGLLVAIPARAELTGNDLHAACQRSRDFCLGYAAGVMAGTNIGGLAGVCTKKGITLGQVQDVIAKYLQDNPENRHMRADVLAGEAMFEAWQTLCAEYRRGEP